MNHIAIASTLAYTPGTVVFFVDVAGAVVVRAALGVQAPHVLQGINEL
jgi:hypothetical protein